jgi:hypothetical protein
MERHLIYYANGFLEQVSEMNSTLERQVNNGIISFIVDTQLGTVLGKSNNPQLPAQWFNIPSGSETQHTSDSAEKEQEKANVGEKEK